jgi:outer membrane protein assembly factor BamB
MKSVYFISSILILLNISCSKQEPDPKSDVPKTLGEKTFQIGAYQTWPEIIDKAHDNGYVVAGTAADAENEYYPFLTLLDDSLKVRKTLFPAYTSAMAWTQGLTRVYDGYVLLSTYGGNQDYTYGVYLTKISFSGSILWEKEYFSGVITWGPNICSDSDNSIIVMCEQAATPDYKFYSRIAKLDSEGTLLWSFDIDPGYLNQPETIITDKQDNYIAIVDSITDNFGAGETRVSVPVVSKINKDGETIWKKRLDSDNGLGWRSIALADKDNNIIVAHQPGGQNVVLKVDPSGNTIWKRTLTGDFNPFERMKEITVDSENNIYIVGETGGLKMLALIKLSPAGEPLLKKLYKVQNSEYIGYSIKTVTENKLVILSLKYSPFVAAVFFMTNAFGLL